MESNEKSEALEKEIQPVDNLAMASFSQKVQWSSPSLDAMAMSTTDEFADTAGTSLERSIDLVQPAERGQLATFVDAEPSSSKASEPVSDQNEVLAQLAEQ